MFYIIDNRTLEKSSSRLAIHKVTLNLECWAINFYQSVLYGESEFWNLIPLNACMWQWYSSYCLTEFNTKYGNIFFYVRGVTLGCRSDKNSLPPSNVWQFFGADPVLALPQILQRYTIDVVFCQIITGWNLQICHVSFEKLNNCMWWLGYILRFRLFFVPSARWCGTKLYIIRVLVITLIMFCACIQVLALMLYGIFYFRCHHEKTTSNIITSATQQFEWS